MNKDLKQVRECSMQISGEDQCRWKEVSGEERTRRGPQVKSWGGGAAHVML